MIYEKLLIEADKNKLITKEKPLRGNRGRIKQNKIAIKADMTQSEKACTLAEELGHFYTTSGDILDETLASNRKQELKARLWSFDRLIGLYGIIKCYKAGCHTTYDMAEHLGVTEEFVTEALDCYKSKYGIFTTFDNYVIYFEPNLVVLEIL